MIQSTDEMHSRSSSFWAQLDKLFVLPFILIFFQKISVEGEEYTTVYVHVV